LGELHDTFDGIWNSSRYTQSLALNALTTSLNAPNLHNNLFSPLSVLHEWSDGNHRSIGYQFHIRLYSEGSTMRASFKSLSGD